MRSDRDVGLAALAKVILALVDGAVEGTHARARVDVRACVLSSASVQPLNKNGRNVP